MSERVERIKTSLEIDENIALHRKGWIVQRVGWCLMLLFLFSAALGLFGNGVLSKASLMQEGTSVAFEKYGRRENETEVEIVARHTGDFLRVVLSPEFVQGFKVERIVPEPASQSMNNGSTVLAFAGEGESQITLFVSARKAGRVHSSLKVDRRLFELEQFIYP